MINIINYLFVFAVHIARTLFGIPYCLFINIVVMMVDQIINLHDYLINLSGRPPIAEI